MISTASTADTNSRARAPGFNDLKLRTDPSPIIRYTTTSANAPYVDPQLNIAA